MVRISHLTVLAEKSHSAYVNGGINRFHLGVVVLKAKRVRVRIVWAYIEVWLRRVVDLVADFPIPDLVVIEDIRVADPIGSFIGCARAIIDGDDCLGPDTVRQER